MLKLLGRNEPVDVGSPVLVTRVSCRGHVLLLQMTPPGARVHPSCHGSDEPTVTVRCRLDRDPAQDLACLELWRVNKVVVRAAVEPGQCRVSLWRSHGRRVELAMAQSVA